MDWETQSRIARSIAADCERGYRWDVYQEIQLKFWLYPPPNRTYAWKEAHSAKAAYFKRERRSDHEELADVHAAPAIDTDARLDLFHLAARYPRELLTLVRYATRGNRGSTPKERVQVLRLRAKLRAAISGNGNGGTAMTKPRGRA